MSNAETVVVEMAMNVDIIRGLQLIAERGARGRNLKEFIKMIELEQKTFRPDPRDKNGHEKRPIPAQFIRSAEHAAQNEPEAAPAPGEGIVEANGQEYVAG